MNQSFKTEQAQSAFDGIQGAFSKDILKFRTPDQYLDNIVGHLICNLMHYCNELQISFEEQLSYAKNHFFFEEYQSSAMATPYINNLHGELTNG